MTNFWFYDLSAEQLGDITLDIYNIYKYIL